MGGHRKLATQDYWDNLIQRVNNRFQNVPKHVETLIITENPEGKGNVAHIPMQQKGGIVKGQTGINSENIDSAPEQVMRIPKYGTIRLLKSRNFAGSEQPDSTFTFAPISKSAYYIPGGTYSRFTNFDGNVETRGYDIDSPNNFTYGETAHRQFNGIRSLWEANKDKRKIIIPKNTGTY